MGAGSRNFDTIVIHQFQCFYSHICVALTLSRVIASVSQVVRGVHGACRDLTKKSKRRGVQTASLPCAISLRLVSCDDGRIPRQIYPGIMTSLQAV